MQRVLRSGYARTLLVHPLRDELEVEVHNDKARFRSIFDVDAVSLVGITRIETLRADNVPSPTLFGISLYMVEEKNDERLLTALRKSLAPTM